MSEVFERFSCRLPGCRYSLSEAKLKHFKIDVLTLNSLLHHSNVNVLGHGIEFKKTWTCFRRDGLHLLRRGTELLAREFSAEFSSSQLCFAISYQYFRTVFKQCLGGMSVRCRFSSCLDCFANDLRYMHYVRSNCENYIKILVGLIIRYFYKTCLFLMVS